MDENSVSLFRWTDVRCCELSQIFLKQQLYDVETVTLHEHLYCILNLKCT